MILGITGGFGCGKSSVLQFFRTRSWFVLDADSVCRDFYENRNPQLMDCIENNFGSDMFLADGHVDRKKLAEKLFSTPEKMQMITGVIYPLLDLKIKNAIADCRARKQHGAFELPLLYEAGYGGCFDAVLAIWCEKSLRKERLKKRNFTPEEVDRRDKMQIAPDEKLEKADFAVINNGSLENLHAQLELLAERFENEI